MSRRFFEAHRGDINFAPAISSILLPVSYVSLEYVLQREGILTEATYPVTDVTPKNTCTYQNLAGTFVYRHVKLLLYTGFQQERYYGIIYHIASPAKSLFDYLYLRPLPSFIRTRDYNLAGDFRLNLNDFPIEAISEFQKYIYLSRYEKMKYILKNLRRNVWQPWFNIYRKCCLKKIQRFLWKLNTL